MTELLPFKGFLLALLTLLHSGRPKLYTILAFLSAQGLILFSSLLQEVLAVYLQQFPDSAIALNLKACNHFRLYNGKAAEVRELYFFLAFIFERKNDNYSCHFA